jgi:branched-chain amino acid transport system substrate-binding protein
MATNNIIKFSATASALAATLFLSACTSQVPEVIKIGVGLTLSGPHAARGQDILNGAKLAADELNRKGFKIDGRDVRIEIVSADDKNDKTTVVEAAKSLVASGVHAVIGHLSTDMTELAIPVYSEHNLPTMFTSTNKNLTSMGNGNNYRLLAHDGLQAKALGGFAFDELKCKKVALINEATSYGKGLADDASADLHRRKATIVLHHDYDAKLTDFAPLIAELKSKEADCIVAVMRDPQMIPLTTQMVANGLKHLNVLASNPSKTAKMAKADVGVKGFYVTATSVEAQEFSGSEEFIKQFKTAFGAPPMWAAHYSFDGVYAIANAAKKAKSVKPAALNAALHALDPLSPVTGTMKFTGGGERAYAAVSVYQLDGGKWDMLMRSDQW